MQYAAAPDEIQLRGLVNEENSPGNTIISPRGIFRYFAWFTIIKNVIDTRSETSLSRALYCPLDVSSYRELPRNFL